MRRFDKHRLKLGKSPRRIPDEIITRFVPCARGKNGLHPVTLALVGNHTEGADKVVIGITCGCSSVNSQEVDAITRLGGEVCLKPMEATRQRFCLGQSSSSSSSVSQYLDIGYSFSSRRGAAKPDKLAPFKAAGETPEAAWSRRFTAAARRTAGAGFSELTVVRATNGELVMQFGTTQVATRASGAWKFDDARMTKDLAYSSGHNGCNDSKDVRLCLVCQKSFAHYDTHLRKGRHISKVVEGIKRAMYRLRKKNPQPRTAHPEGGWR